MSIEEFNIIKAFYDIDAMICTKVLNESKAKQRQDFVSSLAIKSSIEIVLQYPLGANRWTEIATINNLKEPFANGKGLWVGAEVGLYSDSTKYVVTFHSENNLDSLTTVADAKLRSYFAGTVNSQDKIFMNSGIPP